MSYATYPLSSQFSVRFSAYENRLILTTQLRAKGDTSLLLTRRMVMLILQQILNALPELTGLKKTPVAYWQDVLQLCHQQALAEQNEQVSQSSSETNKRQASAVENMSDPEVQPDECSIPSSPALYLATEFTAQQHSDKLVLAFKGLVLPGAMVEAKPHTPVLALSLEAKHVHQVLQLLVSKATEAMWHLPLDLPWLDADVSATRAKPSPH